MIGTGLSVKYEVTSFKSKIFVSHLQRAWLTLYSGRREQRVVAGQKEPKKRFPGFAFQYLGLLCHVLDSTKHTVTQNCLPVDRVLCWKNQLSVLGRQFHIAFVISV